MGCLIVEMLDFGAQSCGTDPCMPAFVGVEDGHGAEIFEWFSDYAIAVVIIEYDQVVVACAGWGDKPPSAVRVNLASWFHHGSIAVVCTFARCQGKVVICIVWLTIFEWVGCHWVDCTFWQLWSRCPCNMGSNCGGCLHSHCNVRPTNLGRYPCYRAASNVDRAGLKSAACAMATSSLAEAPPTMEWAQWHVPRCHCSYCKCILCAGPSTHWLSTSLLLAWTIWEFEILPPS